MTWSAGSALAWAAPASASEESMLPKYLLVWLQGETRGSSMAVLQDLWVLPGLLLLHPEAAKALLQYRIRTLSGALDNARSLGYQVRGPQRA